MFRDQVAVHNAQIMGGAHLYVRTCRCTPFSDLVKGWTDYAEIWYMVRDPPGRLFAKVNDGAQLHVRTCTRAAVLPFPCLGNGWTDCAEIWYAVRDPLAM